MGFIGIEAVRPSYETIVIGSGFASVFFLHEHLKRRRPGRVLLLERGSYYSHAWQVENKLNSLVDDVDFHREKTAKTWHYTIAFGGGTNCWWGYAPRNHPHDFEVFTRYGVGVDWPIGYDDLIDVYGEAEHLMRIAGPTDMGLVYPGAGGYAQPAHRMTTPDRIMKAAQPDRHFALPNARLSRAVDGRGACCASAQCHWCPVEAKFTALNSFGALFAHPDLDILVDAEVRTLPRVGGGVESVHFLHGGREREVRGDLIVLGANAIQSAAILMRSGFTDAALGRYLHEKRVLELEVMLDGVAGLDGSSILSAFNTTMLTGEHRRTGGGGAYNFESHTLHGVRLDYGRWAETVLINILVEDLPLEESRVVLAADGMPETFAYRSDYAERGLEQMLAKLPEVLAPLPVEDMRVVNDDPNFSVHVQGTLRMGRDPATSVVDAGQLHHSARNLLVVGSGVFPTSGTASPSLTIAAMSLRAARRLEASA